MRVCYEDAGDDDDKDNDAAAKIVGYFFSLYISFLLL